MRTLLLIALSCCSLLILSQCNTEKEKREIPDGVLEEKAFKEVLIDLYLVEAESKYRRTNFKEEPDSILPSATHDVFEEHGIERKTFVRSFRFYMEEPDRMERLHEEVLHELMRREKD